jgi:hypothetical protein
LLRFKRASRQLRPAESAVLSARDVGQIRGTRGGNDKSQDFVPVHMSPFLKYPTRISAATQIEMKANSFVFIVQISGGDFISQTPP